MKLNKIFKIKNKKIIFQSAKKSSDYFPNFPEPAYKHVPEWFRKQKLFSNNENDFLKAQKKSIVEKQPVHATYKNCKPIVDTLTSGYIIKTSADCIIINTDSVNYRPSIQWNVSWGLMDSQDSGVLGNYPIPYGYNQTLFRWELQHKIITPPGYSLWITHPSHRYDLPFLTINGFVDTDKHPNRLVLPFFLKDNFEGIIPEGTPIAQIIPIKREEWISEQKQYTEDIEETQSDSVKINLSKVYINKFWTRKNYK